MQGVQTDAQIALGQKLGLPVFTLGGLLVDPMGNGLILTPQIVGNAAADTASIQAAALALYNVGGGTVQLPAKEITINASLPMYQGVKYKGQGSVSDNFGFSLPTQGTVLIGALTFDCFAYNNTPAPNNTQISGEWGTAANIRNCGVEDVFIYGFNTGIHIGDQWSIGCQFSEFKNCTASSCNWGFHFENFIECKWENMYSVNCIQGAQWYGCSGGTLPGGNSLLHRIFNQDSSSSTATTRGIVFNVRNPGAGSNMNFITAFNVQNNRNAAGNSITQAATMTNGSANIVVTNAAAFVVDLPVQLSASVNGFSALQTYFVTSITPGTNTITLSNTMGGASIQATGSTAVNVTTTGFSPIEIFAYSGSTIGPGLIYGMDMEGVSNSVSTLQNANGWDLQFLYGNGNVHVCRTATDITLAQHTVASANLGIRLDADSTSKPIFIHGKRAYAQPVQAGNNGFGLSYNTDNSQPLWEQNTMGLHLSGASSGLPDLGINSVTGNLQIQNEALQLNIVPIFNGQTLTPAGVTPQGQSNVISVQATSTGYNINLGAMSTNGDCTPIWLCNPYNNSITLTPNGSDKINGSASSYTLAANSMALLIPTLSSHWSTGNNEWMIH